MKEVQVLGRFEPFGDSYLSTTEEDAGVPTAVDVDSDDKGRCLLFAGGGSAMVLDDVVSSSRSAAATEVLVDEEVFVRGRQLVWSSKQSVRKAFTFGSKIVDVEIGHFSNGARCALLGDARRRHDRRSFVDSSRRQCQSGLDNNSFGSIGVRSSNSNGSRHSNSMKREDQPRRRVTSSVEALGNNDVIIDDDEEEEEDDDDADATTCQCQSCKCVRFLCVLRLETGKAADGTNGDRVLLSLMNADDSRGGTGEMANINMPVNISKLFPLTFYLTSRGIEPILGRGLLLQSERADAYGNFSSSNERPNIKNPQLFTLLDPLDEIEPLCFLSESDSFSSMDCCVNERCDHSDDDNDDPFFSDPNQQVIFSSSELPLVVMFDRHKRTYSFWIPFKTLSRRWRPNQVERERSTSYQYFSSFSDGGQTNMFWQDSSRETSRREFGMSSTELDPDFQVDLTSHREETEQIPNVSMDCVFKGESLQVQSDVPAVFIAHDKEDRPLICLFHKIEGKLEVLNFDCISYVKHLRNLIHTEGRNGTKKFDNTINRDGMHVVTQCCCLYGVVSAVPIVTTRSFGDSRNRCEQSGHGGGQLYDILTLDAAGNLALYIGNFKICNCSMNLPTDIPITMAGSGFDEKEQRNFNKMDTSSSVGFQESIGRTHCKEDILLSGSILQSKKSKKPSIKVSIGDDNDDGDSICFWLFSYFISLIIECDLLFSSLLFFTSLHTHTHTHTYIYIYIYIYYFIPA